MTEYADPDLETVAPRPSLPPQPVAGGAPPSVPDRGRGPVVGFTVALMIVSLVVGFGVATIVLNARDSSPGSVATGPVSPTVPATTTPSATTPASTSPPGPADPNESALGDVILRQSDVPAGNEVQLLDHGADTTVATLDLCNGSFASEAQRTARRQVALADSQSSLLMSTEAVLYRRPAVGVQAFSELRSVAAHCPSTPVKSPVGEGTSTTKFRTAPDGSWPRTRSVDRLAYDFVQTDATGQASQSIAVYLRRGRMLMGVYFAAPDGPQTPVDGQTTVAGIVGVFEARLAKVPAAVVNG